MFLRLNEFWSFLGPSLDLDLPQCQEPWRCGAEGEPGGIAGNEEQKKTKKTTH